jgi:5-methylcytosine-specific restriction endonuclease McrBC regulatory subunit McrC
VISLREYTTSRVALERRDLVYLLDLAKTSGAPGEQRIFESITPTSEEGTYDIRPGPIVGRLGLPSGQVLDIDSRFEFQDLVSLIRLSGRTPLRIDALHADGGESNLIIDLMATAFAREVERIVVHGLAKGYVRRRFVRPPYPGTLDVEFWIGRQAARSDRLATTAPRLTTSVPVNQVLAAAIDALTAVPLQPETRGRLARVVSAFRGVQRQSMLWSDAASIQLTRLTSRYRDALGLAERILRGRSLAFTGSDLRSASIVFAMPKVWESCVARWAERAWSPGFRTVAGYNFPLTNAGEMTAIADVLVFRGDTPVALYDAKYKDITKAPSADDVYQMVTYCQRLGLRFATLAYPSTPRQMELRVGSTFVRVAGIKDVIEQIDIPMLNH